MACLAHLSRTKTGLGSSLIRGWCRWVVSSSNPRLPSPIRRRFLTKQSSFILIRGYRFWSLWIRPDNLGRQSRKPIEGRYQQPLHILHRIPSKIYIRVIRVSLSTSHKENSLVTSLNLISYNGTTLRFNSLVGISNRALFMEDVHTNNYKGNIQYPRLHSIQVNLYHMEKDTIRLLDRHLLMTHNTNQSSSNYKNHHLNNLIIRVIWYNPLQSKKNSQSL